MVYCPGARVGAPRQELLDNEIVKRLMWTGLVAGTGALASVVAMRLSAADLAAGLRRGPARVTRELDRREGCVRATSRRRPSEDRSVGELVFDVSERVSTLVREEIELAKTEITEKVTEPASAAARSGSRPARSPSSA